MEHLIQFQAFTTTAALSAFLLDNRMVKVLAEKPNLTHVRLALGESSPLKPHHVVTLACLLEEYHQGGIQIQFAPSPSLAYAYLESLGFFSRWTQPDSPGTEGFYPPAGSPSFVLWKVEPEGIPAYVDSAYRHFKTYFFQAKDLSALTTYLAEIFNNISDHAFPATATERIAYCLLQYYPGTRRLFIAVADFGRGIPTSVNQYLRATGQEPLSPVDALRKALERHFSAHSQPYNRGWGLDTLRTGLMALGGNLTIQTSRALYHVSTAGKEIFRTLPGEDFPGTTVAIRLFYDELQPDEPEVLEDEVSLF